MQELTSEQQGHVEKAIRRHGEDLESSLKYIPEHCRDGCREYILNGRPVGDFLSAVFENSLVHAAVAADDINVQCLVHYARLMYNAPKGCWGSKDKVMAWMKSGGLRGVYEEMITRRSSVVVDDEVTDFKGEVVVDDD